MRPFYVIACSLAALSCILFGIVAFRSPRIEQRVISASPTLFRGYPSIIRIHDYMPDKKSVVNANVIVELVQSASLFATYTVDLVADRCCKDSELKPKETPSDLDTDMNPLPLVSGTFGPMLQSKLNLSIPDNLDLTGRDFCIVISNDRRRSRSLTDAARANVVVRYDVKSHRSLSDNEDTMLTVSFLIGFAGVFIALAPAKQREIFANKRQKNKESQISEVSEDKVNPCRFWRRRPRNQSPKPNSDESVQNALPLHGTFVDSSVDETESREGARRRRWGDLVSPSVRNVWGQPSVNTLADGDSKLMAAMKDEPERDAACAIERQESVDSDDNQPQPLAEGQESPKSNVTSSVPLQSNYEAEDANDSSEEAEYLVI